MGKKFWLSTHPKKFGNVRPHHRFTNVKQLSQQVWQPKCNSSLFWREIAYPTASCKAETTKESIKTKREGGNCFCIRVFYSIKLRLIEQEKDREKEKVGGRPAKLT